MGHNAIAHRRVTIWSFAAAALGISTLESTGQSLPSNDNAPECQPQWVSMFSGPNALNGPVYALLIHDFGDGPALYVGGDFTMAGNQVVNNIARWRLTGGGGWSPLGEGFPFPAAAVTDLAVYDDGINGPELYAALDYFAIVGKWNGSEWQTLAPASMTGFATSLVVYNDGSGDALYVGGWLGIQDTVHTLLRWDGKAFSPTNVGEGGKGGFVTKCAEYDDGSGSKIYLSGNFIASTDGSFTSARGNGTSWSSITEWHQGWIAELAVVNDGSGASLYAGCYLWGTNPPVTGVGKWTAAGFIQLGTGFSGACTLNSCVGYCNRATPSGCWCDWMCCGFQDCCFDVNSVCGHCLSNGGTYCAVHTFAAFDDGSGIGSHLYAAGAFDGIGNVAVQNIAKWNGQDWSPVNEGVSTVSSLTKVSALAAYQPTNGDPPILFAGGNFTSTVVGDKYLVAYVGCPIRPQCAAADINCDGSVNVADLLSVINTWGACPAPPAKCSADIAPPPNGDGQINVADLLMIINNWG